FVESFHSRFRDECLNREQLWTLTEARVVIEDFRLEYNAERPHRSLGYLSPQRFVAEKSLPIPSGGTDRQAGPSLRLGLPTTTAVITSTNAAD
ncbi:MAG: transposase, partial [Opitutus sp.]|nr:transposase [Opitutus sp.]